MGIRVPSPAGPVKVPDSHFVSVRIGFFVSLALPSPVPAPKRVGSDPHDRPARGVPCSQRPPALQPTALG
jgi:hypothetical protein